MTDDIDLTYRGIGEFVVTFSWIEAMYRQIGWFILDPERSQWPPIALRNETPRQLIKKVTDLFVDLTAKYNFANGLERADDFSALSIIFDDLAGFRNRLLHSNFIELKAGRELVGHWRVNPQFQVDPETGQLITDGERNTSDVVYETMKAVAEPCLRLSQHHIQLVHWAPFERHGLR